MTDLARRLAKLSPAKRKALIKVLEQREDAAEAAPAEEPPSDFPLAGLDQAELDNLLGDRRGVEDVYPLSPLQHGMLFHSLLRPGSGEYLGQMGLTLTGSLDVPALRRAWERVYARHAVLRSAFFLEGLQEPLQVVYRTVPLPWEEKDWRESSPAEARKRLKEKLRDDLRRGFAPDRAPLSRLRLIRLAENEWRFVWSTHHALFDGWSAARVIAEVAVLYTALRQGLEPELEPCRPYRDYVAWLRRRDPAAAEAYWRRALQGLTAPTLLGQDRRQASSELEDHRVFEMRLPPSESAALQALAARHQLTLGTLFEGAWGLLLARVTGRGDVLFGVTVSGRSVPPSWIEPMVGLFINTLPRRLRPRTAGSLFPWLKEVQDHRNELLEHEDSTLEKIRQWSEIDPESPLFDHILVFESFPTTTRKLSDDVEISDHQTFERTNYPLAVVVYPESEIVLRLGYDRRDFEATAVRRLTRHLCNLLKGFTERPEARLGELSALSVPERHQLLTEWNDTAATSPLTASLAELFEEQVDAAPGAVAVCDGAVRLSYRQLDERANRLAHYLLRKSGGIVPETPIALYLERSVELIVAILAVQKAGGAYLPLDLDYPAERLALMIDDSGAPWVVSRGELAARLAELGYRVLDLAEAQEAVAASPAGRLPPRRAGAELAYLIYTSGSTGVPKAVAVPQAAVVRLVRNTSYLPFGPEERIGQISNTTFDAATFEIWGALLNGGRLEVIGRSVLLSLDDLSEELRRRGVTAIFLTAAMAHLMAQVRPDGFASLRHLIVGGEALVPRWIREILTAGAPARLLNGYGPTECTTFAVCSLISAVPAAAASIPIGRPISNTRGYVLDGRGHLCPLGAWGELYLGGPGLARGYHARPALTAGAFVPDDLSGERGARLYRTGDRVRHLADGNVDFSGRFDHQVKLRGFRIELGEIETVLMDSDLVRECVVVTRELRPGDLHVVAHVVADTPNPAAEPREEALRAFLKKRLPEFMVPTAFDFLDALPLNQNGKVDRRALSAREVAVAPVELVAPRTSLEKELVEIWCELLALETLGVCDNFFHVGGHSLLVTQLFSIVRKKYHVELPLRSFFEAPTVEELAERIELARWANVGPAETETDDSPGELQEAEIEEFEL